MQELRSATESQRLRTSKRTFDVKNITLHARELIWWPKKKDEFGRRRLQALLGKTARRGPHGRLQTNWYPNVHVPSAQSTHLNMTIKKEDKKKAIEGKNR